MAEAYLDGRDWLARNDGDRNPLMFEMRAAAEILDAGLWLVVFLAARESFGDGAGIAALGRLRLARAQAMSGHCAAARKSYEDFRTVWKDADPDLPAYRETKAEYARLVKAGGN